MAWIRWRTTLKGQRRAYLQWRDDLDEVHSNALKTDNEAVAQIPPDPSPGIATRSGDLRGPVAKRARPPR